MGGLISGGCFKSDVKRPDSFTNTAIIRAALWDVYLGKNGANRALCSSQDGAEYRFNRQDGCDDKIRIAQGALP